MSDEEAGRGLAAGVELDEASPALAPAESAVCVSGTVKWFDGTRGFGFMIGDDGEGDVLIHFSVLREHDRR